MNTKLILIEGLPGSGKTSTATFIYDILTEKKIPAELFLEGNLDHPADYDGVSCLTENDFDDLLSYSGDCKDVLIHSAVKKGNDYLVTYRKIKSEYGARFPDELTDELSKHDIYELPLEQHMELIVEKWAEFTEKALAEEKIYIFECCFIQNPITIGMVKYGENKEKVIQYVMRLAKIIEGLKPLLVYVEQEDLERSFGKAMEERPKAWLDGFVDYYTHQGYGKEHCYNGVEGTLKVLEARSAIEREIVERVEMKKETVDNSQFEAGSYKEMLAEKLIFYGVIKND